MQLVCGWVNANLCPRSYLEFAVYHRSHLGARPYANQMDKVPTHEKFVFLAKKAKF